VYYRVAQRRSDSYAGGMSRVGEAHIAEVERIVRPIFWRRTTLSNSRQTELA